MSTLLDEHDVQVALAEPAVWPNLSQAAGIVGLTKSTLSKQANAGHIEYDVLGLGRGRYVVSPVEVLRIGSRYRRLPEEMIVDRLTTFLVPRLHTESGLVRRALRRILEGVTSPEKLGASETRRTGQPRFQSEQDAIPAWLLEVEDLRAEPRALAGHFSFVSPEDVNGRIRFGPLVDDVADLTGVDWQAG